MALSVFCVPVACIAIRCNALALAQACHKRAHVHVDPRGPKHLTLRIAFANLFFKGVFAPAKHFFLVRDVCVLCVKVSKGCQSN